MGFGQEIGVSTGEASQAAVTADTVGAVYEEIDHDFRAVVAAVSDALADSEVASGLSAFCDVQVVALARLRAQMHGTSQATEEASRRARQTDRGNAERFEQSAV